MQVGEFAEVVHLGVDDNPKISLSIMLCHGRRKRQDSGWVGEVAACQQAANSWFAMIRNYLLYFLYSDILHLLRSHVNRACKMRVEVPTLRLCGLRDGSAPALPAPCHAVEVQLNGKYLRSTLEVAEDIQTLHCKRSETLMIN